MKKIILLMLIMFPIILSAQFSGGAGTALNPYMLANATDLGNMKTYPTSHFKLANSIDCGGADITPTGTEAAPFTGTFDGNGFFIITANFINVNIPSASPTKRYWGMFGYTSGATITNLTLKQCTISIHDPGNLYLPFQEQSNLVVEYSLGILAAKTSNTNISYITIDNCSVYVLIDKCSYQSSQIEFLANQGGMIGSAGTGTISNCSVINLISTAQYNMSGCPYIVPVKLYNAGIAGSVNGSSISQTYSNSFVSLGNASCDGDVYVAGFVGNFISGSIANSYATIKTGSLYGMNWQPSFSSPNNYPSSVYLSGFVGKGVGATTKCYSILYQNIIGIDSKTRYGYFNSPNYTGTASGSVATDDKLISNNMTNYTYRGIYGGTITNADTLQMKDIALWAARGFDFINTWAIDGAKNYGYPYLINNTVETTLASPSIPTLWQPSNGEAGVTVIHYPFSFSSANATSYRYEIYTMADVLVASGYTSANQIGIDNILNYDTQYKWRVLGINAAGSTYSSYYTFSTETFTGTLDAPVLNYPSADTTGMVLPYNFSWTASPNATSYDFEIWNTAASIQFGTTVNQAGVSKSVSGTLSNGVRYKWRVRAKSTGNSSLWSERYFTATLSVPDTVTLVSPVNNDTTLVLNQDKMIWNKENSAVKYYLVVIDTLSADTTYQGWIYAPDTTYTPTQVGGFVKKTWYKWKVKANNTAGDGVYSIEKFFKPLRYGTDTGSLPELPQLGVVPNCLSGEGGIITAPTNISMTWNWSQVKDVNEYVRPIGFYSPSDFTKTDTLFVAGFGTTADNQLIIADSVHFSNDVGDAVWMAANPHLMKTTAPWVDLDIGGNTTMTGQVTSATVPESNATIQLNDSTFIEFYMQDYNYGRRPVYVIVTNGIATRYAAGTNISPAYEGYFCTVEKPILLNDSLLVTNINQEKLTSANAWTNSYFVIFNLNDHTWKRNFWKRTDHTGTGDIPTDIVTGIAQLDTSLYFYSNNLPLYTGAPLDSVKFWKFTPSGLTKILTMTYTDSLSTNDYNLIYNFRTQADGDSLTSVVVNSWHVPTDCYWYFQTYNITNAESKIWKLHADSISSVVLPSPAGLKLSGAYISPTGEYAITIFQNWSEQRGGLNAKGYLVHLLTGIIDTLSSVPVSNVSGTSADSVGLFNCIQVWKNKIYMFHKRSATGFWSTSIMPNSPSSSRIWWSDIIPISRTPLIIRSDEYLLIRGIKPKATLRARVQYR